MGRDAEHLNLPINQTMVNDVHRFAGKMAKLSALAKTVERADGTTTDLTRTFDNKRRMDPSHQIGLGFYMAFTMPDDIQKIQYAFFPDVFDLIVIAKCHRDSAADDAACTPSRMTAQLCNAVLFALANSTPCD
jgi:type I restriction enzyme R subunit